MMVIHIYIGLLLLWLIKVWRFSSLITVLCLKVFYTFYFYQCPSLTSMPLLLQVNKSKERILTFFSCGVEYGATLVEEGAFYVEGTACVGQDASFE